MKATPYNTGKVKIGETVYLNKLVNQPYVEQDYDMIELQTYLLHEPRQVNRAYWIARVYFVCVGIVALLALLSL